MTSLNDHIEEYQRQLDKGHIQRAYKGIMTFMSGLRSALTKAYPSFYTSALYFGTMDMTYFAFTPPQLREKELKIAIVYLHEDGAFEAWLSGRNRKVQAETIEQLKDQNLREYKLSQVKPGVDSIIETLLVKHPNFNHPEALRNQIEKKTLKFIMDMEALFSTG